MKKTHAVFFLFVLLPLSSALSAQVPAGQPKDDQLKEDQAKEGQLKLIPEPKEVRLQEGGFLGKP